MLGQQMMKDFNQIQCDGVAENQSGSQIRQFSRSEKPHTYPDQIIEENQENLSYKSNFDKVIREFWPMCRITRIRYLAILNIIQIFNRYW